MNEKWRVETLAVHAGAEVDRETRSLAPPIHLTTTFEHPPDASLASGPLYIREGNPTEERLERALALLEGGSEAIVYASGVAAGTALLQSLPEGSHVLIPNDCYYAFRAIAVEFFPRWRMTSTQVDMTDLEAIRAAIRPETRLFWLETPSNPLMAVTDLAGAIALARAQGALTMVDNTFATPLLQRPLDLGADIVLHSTTKYFGGHSDVQGGALIFKKATALSQQSRHVRHLLGSVASPFNSWLVLRGLRSLPCRMERHSDNALHLATALSGHPALNAIHYPGLTGDPGHQTARRQMRKFGGMLSLRVAGGRQRALEVASKLRIFTNATSLGGTESLVEHRASSEGPASTTPDDLLRLSVGLEHPDDLLADLQQALESG
jgi:cystathionine gamma-synthase